MRHASSPDRAAAQVASSLHSHPFSCKKCKHWRFPNQAALMIASALIGQPATQSSVRIHRKLQCASIAIHTLGLEILQYFNSTEGSGMVQTNIVTWFRTIHRQNVLQALQMPCSNRRKNAPFIPGTALFVQIPQRTGKLLVNTAMIASASLKPEHISSCSQLRNGTVA